MKSITNKFFAFIGFYAACFFTLGMIIELFKKASDHSRNSFVLSSILVVLLASLITFKWPNFLNINNTNSWLKFFVMAIIGWVLSYFFFVLLFYLALFVLLPSDYPDGRIITVLVPLWLSLWYMPLGGSVFCWHTMNNK